MAKAIVTAVDISVDYMGDTFITNAMEERIQSIRGPVRYTYHITAVSTDPLNISCIREIEVSDSGNLKINTEKVPAKDLLPPKKVVITSPIQLLEV